MKYLISLLMVISSVFSTTLSAEESYKVIGYFTDWGKMTPKDINPSLVTHINYAFVKVDTAGNLHLYEPWADVQRGEIWNVSKPYWGNFRELYDLKQKHPHIKTLASIGGWTLSDTFSEMAEHPESRKHFIESCINFCKKYDFDGVDLDWEYPGYAEHRGRPQDTVNFTLLLQELHAAAKAQNPPLLVTIAAPAGPWHYCNMEVAKIHEYLDWINLMTYDFCGPWAGQTHTNHQAPLFAPEKGNPDLCVEAAVNYYMSQGVPAKKLVVGMPLYGRTFGQVSGPQGGLFGTYSGPGSTTTGEAGMRVFNDIKRNALPTYEYHWDEKAKAPYLYHPGTRDFITFENADSVRLKCEWIKRRGLAGAMVWELGLDTYPEFEMMHMINASLGGGHSGHNLVRE